ncbi:MAG: hypothetical protein K5919_05070 [Clostridiales bacterium]|nr:hypothetical protein [Clostridiales bacterium]
MDSISDFVVIDCETTFSRVTGHVPIELGAIRYKDSIEIDRFSALVNPGIPVAPAIEEITGITNEEIKNVPLLKNVLPGFLAFIGDCLPVVGHNIRFDLSAIDNACKMVGIDLPVWTGRVIDTMSLAADVFRHVKLKNCARWLGIATTCEHRAAEDCNTTALVFLALQKEVQQIAKEKQGSSPASTPAIGTRLGVDKNGQYFMERIGQKQKGGALSPYERYQKLINDVIEEAKNNGVCFTDIHFAFHGDLLRPHINRTGGLDKIIESLDGAVHKKASGKVDYYVCFDDEETGTVKEAKQIAADPRYHLQIIDTESFLELLGYNGREPNTADPAMIRIRKANERQAAIDQAKAEEERKAARLAKAKQKHEETAKKTEKPIGRPVYQLDRGGEIIKRHSSITMAAAELGISTKVIRDAATGKQKTAGGYCWRYADQDNLEDKS